MPTPKRYGPTKPIRTSIVKTGTTVKNALSKNIPGRSTGGSGRHS